MLNVKEERILLSETQDLGKKRAVALGFFDGIHIGHRKLISTMIEKARENGLIATVFTLSNFPTADSEHLTTREEKIEILRELGADEIVCADFGDIRNMPARDFIMSYLVEHLNAALLVYGTDYRFGAGAEGDAKMLETLSDECGIDRVMVEDVYYEGEKCSSSRIRRLLSTGAADEVRPLLGDRFFSYEGIVQPGKKLGRTLGFPTTNIMIPKDKFKVRFGVYRSLSYIGGREYPSISNIGIRPTVEDSENINCETFVYNFHEDVYGQSVKVGLMEFIREEKRFGSVDELKEQVESDKKKVANLWEINIIGN